MAAPKQISIGSGQSLTDAPARMSELLTVRGASAAIRPGRIKDYFGTLARITERHHGGVGGNVPSFCQIDRFRCCLARIRSYLLRKGGYPDHSSPSLDCCNRGAHLA